MLLKEKVKLLFVLFFLSVFQYINIERLWGIDFFLIGLIFFAYFTNIFWLITTTVVILLLNFLISGEFLFLSALGYLFLPILAQRISSVLNLNFSKYFILCIFLLVGYIFLGLITLNLLSFRNFFIISLKNLIAAGLIQFIFRYALLN